MTQTFQQAMFKLAFDPIASGLLSKSAWESVSAYAEHVTEEEFYSGDFDMPALDVLLSKTFPDRCYAPADYIRHQLWCSWREAKWQNGMLTSDSSGLHIRNEHYCLETSGHPTLVVTPMTTALSDAVLLLKHIAMLYHPRPLVLYGEGMESIYQGNSVPEAWLARDGMAGMKRIRQVLSRGGVLCTYPDMVYEGHLKEAMPFMNHTRPLSSGFVSFACKEHVKGTSTMLLPCVLLHEGDYLVAQFEEPVELSPVSLATFSREERHNRVSSLIGQMLEDLIHLAGPQWLLLPTLSHLRKSMVAA